MPPTANPQKKKSFVIKTMQDLMDKLGDKAEPILYALLCNEQNPLRKTVDEALRGGKSGVAVLVPLLIAQFALAPAVAAVVAGFVVKTLASKGQEKLCEELAEARSRKEKTKRRARSRRPKPQAKRRAAQSAPK